MPLERANHEGLALRRVIIASSAFSTLSAIAGGLGLTFWPRGNRYLPISVLEFSPFHSFTIPGLLLALVVGGASLASTVTAWRRSSIAMDALLLAGGALTIWSAAGCAILRELSWWHLAYGFLGLALLGLGVAGSLASRSHRQRWILYVTVAEILGFSVPALTAIFTSHLSATGEPLAGWVVAAGAVEGFVLGFGQSRALPVKVRTWRFVGLTALGAVLVWAVVMSMLGLAQTEEVSSPILALAALATAVVALGAIGSAQWLELRHHVPHAARWIGWTALAWALALPLSFLPGPFVDESTPLLSHVVLWTSGGLLMAYTMAVVTWQGVRRLIPRTGPSGSSVQYRRSASSSALPLRPF